MIQLLRVDHRLLHGQVVFSWCGQLNPNCILIANDAAATDDVRKAALRLGKPNNAKLVIKTVDDSIAAINGGKTDKYSLMIVTGNVKDAVRLARETTQIKSINLGGTKSAPDRHALSHTVYVSDEEEKLLHEAAAEGIEVFIQAVPSDSKKILT